MALSHDDLDKLITKIHDNAGDALGDIAEDLQAVRQDSFEREATEHELTGTIKELQETNKKLVESNSGLFVELGQQRKEQHSSEEQEQENIQANLTLDSMTK